MIPALRGWRQDSLPQLHSEMEASLGYMRLCREWISSFVTAAASQGPENHAVVLVTPRKRLHFLHGKVLGS